MAYIGMTLVLCCVGVSLLAMAYPVMASFIQPPQNQSVLLNSTATFSCVANNVESVTYLVNSMPIFAVASLGVIQSLPLTNGSRTSVNLTIPGTAVFINSQVMCLTYLAGTRDDSPPAYLLVAAPAPPSPPATPSAPPPAPPSAPQHLTHDVVAGTFVDLTWSPPMDPGIGGQLYYNVSYQAISGSSNVTSNITNDTHVNVTNLNPGVTYMMTVEADNGVPGDESKRSASINVTTHSTGTLPTYTVPSPALSNALKVAVGIVVPLGGVVVVVVLLMALKYKKAVLDWCHQPSAKVVDAD